MMISLYNSRVTFSDHVCKSKEDNMAQHSCRIWQQKILIAKIASSLLCFHTFFYNVQAREANFGKRWSEITLFGGWGYHISLKLKWTMSINEMSVTCTYCIVFHSYFHDHNLNVIFTLVTVIVNTVQWQRQISDYHNDNYVGFFNPSLTLPNLYKTIILANNQSNEEVKRLTLAKTPMQWSV
jgi:hypothetical protein